VAHGLRESYVQAKHLVEARLAEAHLHVAVVGLAQTPEVEEDCKHLSRHPG